jgi:hypothetical protein
MKDAYYFSHDSNARHDYKILHLRSKWGWAGYGMYWAVVEMLRDIDGYRFPKDHIGLINMELQGGNEKLDVQGFVHDCIHTFHLFEEDETHFWSASLLRRMEKRETISQKRAEYGKRGGESKSKGFATANGKQASGKPVALKERKGKEKKEIYTSDFESWYSGYPRKVSKGPAAKVYASLREEGAGADELIRARDGYRSCIQSAGTEERYVLHPSTFLHEDRWRDYLETAPAAPAVQPVARVHHPSCPALDDQGHVCGGRVLGGRCMKCLATVIDGKVVA